MSYQALRVFREGPVGWLVFDRPDKGNAMDATMLTELEHAFKFNDAVLRHLTVKMDEAVTGPSPMMKEEKSRAMSTTEDAAKAAPAPGAADAAPAAPAVARVPGRGWARDRRPRSGAAWRPCPHHKKIASCQ